MAAACIASLFKNTDPGMEIIILDTGIEHKTKTKFQKWAKQKNRILKFISITAETYKHFLASEIELPSDIAYYPRLLAPYFANNNLDKILYIDADIVCQRNPATIFDFNLGENVIGAVQDQYLQTMSNGIINYDKIALEKDGAYFNSGVLLIDVKKWISSKILNQVCHTAIVNKEFVTYFDQYSLNVVFYDKWHKLNVEWNEMYGPFDSLTYFRHFAGQKPLDLSFTATDADLFFAYLKLSPYLTWWWKSVSLRYFIAKFHWKLKFYSNKIFNTKFPIETLNI